MDSLSALEAESIHILREVAAQCARPALLFSGGKDSLVLLRLAEKAFRPERFPFPILHIDTGHNFPETLEFRDRTVARLGETLHVRKVEDSIRQGRAVEETSAAIPSRNALQTVTLLDAIAELKLTAAIGGARRDEEKSRAKERVFSFRDSAGQWDPRNQRPELWSLYNGRVSGGEHVRVFPLSDWTELDVWRYIEREALAVPSLYFAHERECVSYGEQLLAVSPFVPVPVGQTPRRLRVRFRTVGDMTCTAALESTAATLAEVIDETAASLYSERASRIDDQRSEWAMEERKRRGYF